MIEIAKGTVCRHFPSGRMVEVTGDQVYDCGHTGYPVRWIDGLHGVRHVHASQLEVPVPASQAEPSELRRFEPVGPVEFTVTGLAPGSRLVINLEVPYDREAPVLHSTYDPEADE